MAIYSTYVHHTGSIDTVGVYVAPSLTIIFFLMLQTSIALTDYADINWDIPHNFPRYPELLGAVNELKNETVYSSFNAYPKGTAFGKFYHDGLHSQISGSDVSFPHSLVHHPIHSIPGDFNSDIVAYAMGGVAWDFALRFLLPQGVDGIIVEVENNYNRTVSYQISGQDAFFLGDGAKHETKYEHMKVTRSLFPRSTRSINIQFQVCYYTIVSNSDVSTLFSITAQHSYSRFNFTPLFVRTSIQVRNLRHRTKQVHQGTSRSLLHQHLC
jgi:hypothetical protein